MSKEQILKKAIKKAVDNGFNKYKEIIKNPSLIWCNSAKGHYELIFSHEFAKAFWGENIFLNGKEFINCITRDLEVWQYHLQQMVLEKDPIKYLEKFL